MTRNILPAPLTSSQIKNQFRQQDLYPLSIDVDASTLKKSTLLTYITNLNITHWFYFSSIEGYFDLLETYMGSGMVHALPQLENGVLDLLRQVCGLKTSTGVDYKPLIERPEMLGLIHRWLSLIGSLSVYNLKWSTSDVDDEVLKNNYPVNTETDNTGINFFRLIPQPDLPLIIASVKKSTLKFYQYFFTEPVFKGMPLEVFWCQKDNILFTLGLLEKTDTYKVKQFHERVEQATQTLKNEVYS